MSHIRVAPDTPLQHGPHVPKLGKDDAAGLMDAIDVCGVPKQYLPTVDLTVKSSGANGNQGFSLGYGRWKQLRGIPWNFLHICIAYVLTGACGRISRRSEPYIELINTRSRSKISTCCCVVPSSWIWRRTTTRSSASDVAAGAMK